MPGFPDHGWDWSQAGFLTTMPWHWLAWLTCQPSDTSTPHISPDNFFSWWKIQSQFSVTWLALYVTWLTVWESLCVGSGQGGTGPVCWLRPALSPELCCLLLLCTAWARARGKTKWKTRPRREREVTALSLAGLSHPALHRVSHHQARGEVPWSQAGAGCAMTNRCWFSRIFNFLKRRMWTNDFDQFGIKQ